MFRLFMAALPLFLFQMGKAQSALSNHAYAITSTRMGTQDWTEVRQIDLSNGSATMNVFENSKGLYEVYDGRSSKKIILNAKDSGNTQKRPFGGLSAACAYDKRTNRLYYAPLLVNGLRYIDLRTATPSIYLFENGASGGASIAEREANQVTRMAIAADGNGYALNNDGSHLVKFTTGTIPVVTDLGGLLNAAGNDTISVSDPNTSWGGDMVADAGGSLFLITAHNLLFKINIQTKVASFVRKIKGLPEGYTTNGAAVDAEGYLVLNSANSISGYYRVTPSTWEAKIIPTDAQVYNTSDLANENLLYRTALAPVATNLPEQVIIYPNPVKTNAFKVTFTNKKAGDYNITLLDIAGRTISDKAINVLHSGQVAEVKINPSLARGVYLVKVTNQDNKEIFSKKLIVE